MWSMTPSMIRLRKELIFVFFCPQAPLGRGPLTAFLSLNRFIFKKVKRPNLKARNWKFELNFCV